MSETVIHSTEHAAQVPGEAAAALASAADRDLERVVGEHSGKLDAHETLLTELKGKVEDVIDRVDNLASSALQAPVDVAGVAREEAERVARETLEAAEAAAAAAAAHIEEVAPPEPAGEPKRQKLGFWEHLGRLV